MLLELQYIKSYDVLEVHSDDIVYYNNQQESISISADNIQLIVESKFLDPILVEKKIQKSRQQIHPRVDVVSYNRLFEYALPTKGSYKDHIGYIQYQLPNGQNYTTLIMTKTDNLKVGKNTYQTIEGYIQVQPFIDEYIKYNPKSTIKDIRHWYKSNKKYIDTLEINKRTNKVHREELPSEKMNDQNQDPNFMNIQQPLTISILGSAEIKGTYFHPSIFTHALIWACQGFQDIVNQEFEQQIIQQNRQIHLSQCQYDTDDFISCQSDANQYQLLEEYDNIYVIPKVTTNILTNNIIKDMLHGESFKKYIPLQNPPQQNLQEEINTIQLEIEELQVLKNQSSSTDQKLHILEQIYGLTNQLNSLEKTKLQNQNIRKGILYCLKWKQNDQPFYIGITEQNSKGILEPHEVRFSQHKLQTLQVFKNHDLTHIIAAGKVAEYMLCTNQTIINTKIMDDVFCSDSLEQGYYKENQLEERETQIIQEILNQGYNITNKNKRLSIARSNSCSSMRESSIGSKRIQKMRKASKSNPKQKDIMSIESKYQTNSLKENEKEYDTPIQLKNMKYHA